MIKRIVKMTFHPENVQIFLDEVFEHSKSKIRAFPGCRHMELLRQHNRPEVMFTISYWERPEDLETYRQSELFKNTWAKTKVLFAHPAEAWSAEVIDMPKD